VDMIEQGYKAFATLEGVSDKNTVLIAEISLNDLHGKDANMTEKDIMERVKLLNLLGYNVMISDYTRYFSLRAYFRQYTQLQIGIVVGMINIKQIFDEEFYRGLEGGILEGFGKLFPDNTRLFVYPERDEKGILNDLTTVSVPNNLRYLFRHVLDNGFITSIKSSDIELFNIFSREILQQICRGQGEWVDAVPEAVSKAIMEQKLFGYRG
jgi:hypothetical protein